MEDIRQSVSRMFNRMRKPSMKSSKVANSPIKAGKVFSSPNLLHLPSGQLQQKASTQKRSQSLSQIAEKQHPALEEVNSDEFNEKIESLMQKGDMDINSVPYKEKPVYQNTVLVSGEISKIRTGKQKKIPPKRPPPPKVLPQKYQNRIRSSLHRSKSDSHTLGNACVNAKFDEGKLDKCNSKTTDGLNLYMNVVNKSNNLQGIYYCNQFDETVNVGESYISMTGQNNDMDENGYVMMSRDHKLTSLT